MSRKNQISEEVISAFVDGELDSAECSRLIQLRETDAELDAQLKEMEKLKSLVFSARPETAKLDFKAHSSAKGWLFKCYYPAMAASLILGLVLLGLMTLGPFKYGGSKSIPLQSDNLESLLNTPGSNEEIKIVMHFTQDNVSAAQYLLDQAELLTTRARERNKLIRIEIIAHGKGLSLLRRDRSPFPQRISQMRKTYDQITFLACNQTLNKVNAQRDKAVELLAVAVIVASGLQQIQLRRTQGWNYFIV